MGAESKMRYELEKSGQASGFLAEGLTDQTNVMPGRSATPSNECDAKPAPRTPTHCAPTSYKMIPNSVRGQRQVEPTGGDRSDDIHEAMLQAQRRQDQLEERARRRRP